MRHEARMRWVAAALACVALLAAGWGQRALQRRIDAALRQVAPLQRPLTSLPMALGEWRGVDVPLQDGVRAAAHFDDEYVNRIYTQAGSGATVGVFVGYVGRPRARLGHRPDVCYAATGWREVGQQSAPVVAPGGQVIPALLYEFRKPGGDDTLRVLATYMINGRFVQDPEAFRRFNARSANLLGERPAYLARIQVAIAGPGERDADFETLREFVAGLAGPTADLLPYWGS